MDNDDLLPDDFDPPGLDDLDPGRDQPDDRPIVPPVEPPGPLVGDDDRIDIPDIPVPDLPPREDFELPVLDEAIDLIGEVDPDRSADGEPGESVDLQLDQPLEVDHGSPAATEPRPGADVDLSLDPEHDDLEPAPTEDADDPDVVELPLPGQEPAYLEVAEGNAWLTNGLIAAGLVAIGAAAPTLARLRRATPPDLAAHLDGLGIDARVEHLDLTGLEELLRAGRTVLLSTDGSAGVDAAAVLLLRSIDRAEGRLLVVDGRGERASVELERFEAAWSDSANQVVLAAGSQGGGVALIPVVLGGADLLASR